MITLSPSTPPTPAERISGQAMIDALSLLSMLADPKQSAALLGSLWQAQEAWVNAKADAEKALGELRPARAAHDVAIAAERLAHEASMKAERDKCNQDCERSMAEIDAKAAETDRLNARARVDAQAAALSRADLDARLAKLKSAME